MRHVDSEADIEDAAQETICDVTLLANSAESDEQIELRRNKGVNDRVTVNSKPSLPARTSEIH